MPFPQHLYLSRRVHVHQDLGYLERPTLTYGTYVRPSLELNKAGKPEKTIGSAPIADTNVT